MTYEAFRDRRDAGRQLADALARFAADGPRVLALPRGGVPVGYEVAVRLGAPLDLLLVRKIGAPGHPEFGIGAVADGSPAQTVLNEEAMSVFAPDAAYIQAERRRQLAEIERRRAAYLGDRAPADVSGRLVILVDDGIATGGTAKVALIVLRRAGARRIVLAVPVAAPSALEALGDLADEIVCLLAPQQLHAVGLYYADFRQTGDAEVVELLRLAREEHRSTAGAGEKEVSDE